MMKNPSNLLRLNSEYSSLIEDLITIVNYSIDNKKSIQETSEYFDISRSKMCSYIHHMLKYEEPELYRDYLTHLLEVEV